MASDARITSLAPYTTVHGDDLLVGVDVHDTSMAATGTDKKLTIDQLFAAFSALAPAVSVVPRALRFAGPPEATHVNHGLFWAHAVGGVLADLGTGFLWDAWVAPTGDGYLVSDGYGGAHALLWGFSGGITGNIWNGSTTVSYTGSYAPGPREWVHVAVGWDGARMYTYVNGLPDRCIMFAGPRKSPGGYPDGNLFVGGSDHSNLTMDLALIRGWDRFNPIADRGSQKAGFIPERTPYRIFSGTTGDIPCDFYCDYTFPGACWDSSPSGVDNGVGRRVFHHGAIGNSNGNSGAFGENPFPPTTCPVSMLPPWPMAPFPAWVDSPDCPLNRPLGSSPAPVELARTPLAVPAGAKVFDSFRRPNQTFAFQSHPTLGQTEGGSRGPLTWQQGPAGATSPDNTAPYGCFWGILGGQARPIGKGQSLAWVDVGSQDQDLRISRTGYQAGAAGPGDNWTYEGFELGLAFWVKDRHNFWALTWSGISDNPNDYYGNGAVISFVDDVATVLWNDSVYLGAKFTLRVLTTGTTIKVYHGDDGVPGTWTLDQTITGTPATGATGAGLTTATPYGGSISSFSRLLNFTCF